MQPQATAGATAPDSQPGSNANALAAEPAQSSTPAEQLAGTQTAALPTGQSVQFLKLEGMPQSAASTLSNSLGATAQSHGLNLLSPTQAGAAYRIQGYFSALSDGSGTLLVYVWDVLDASGKRVHRINGQERSGSTNVDPWQSITDDELRRVADRTTVQLKSWVETRKS